MPCGDPRRWAQRGAAGHIGVPAAQRSGQARAKSQSVKALRLHVRDLTQSRGPHEHPGGTAGRCAHTSSCAAGAWPLSRQQQHLSNPPGSASFLALPSVAITGGGGSPPNLEGSRTQDTKRCSLLAARARGAGRSWAGTRGSRVQEAAGHAVHQLHDVSVPHGPRRAAHLQPVPGETQAGWTGEPGALGNRRPRRQGSEATAQPLCTADKGNAGDTERRRLSRSLLKPGVMLQAHAWSRGPRSYFSCSVIYECHDATRAVMLRNPSPRDALLFNARSARVDTGPLGPRCWARSRAQGCTARPRATALALQ